MKTGFVEEALPKKLNASVWLKIGKYAFRHWKLLLGSVAFMLFSTFYDSSFVPVMNAAAIDMASRLAEGYHPEAIIGLSFRVTFLFGIQAELSFFAYFFLMVGLALFRCVSVFFSMYLTNLLSMHIVIDLRRDTFAKIQELSFSFFDKNSSGWLIARMQGDTSTLSETLAWTVFSLAWAVFQIGFSVATMFSISWQFSLIVLASLPLVALILPFFQRQILKSHRTARNASSYFTGHLSESILGAKEIKSLGLEEKRIKEAKEYTSDIQKKRCIAHTWNAFLEPVLSLFSGALLTIVVFFGNAQVSAGAATAATIVLFVSFVNQIFDPLRSLSESFSEFLSSQAGAEKVMQLLEATPDIKDTKEVEELYGTVLSPKVETFSRLEGKIEFKNVSFDYGNGIEVIHPLNLTIEPGTSLAIVGETGSGKTTLVNLLCRFYEPTKGEIYVDGIPYKERSLSWLRSNIAYVQQSPFVFKGTFADNIAYGKVDATRKQIEEAAEKVGIKDFILSQEKGFDTELSYGGEGLSLGQKQLISFARALLRDPSILLLDEATSSIDTLTEAKLQEACNKLRQGRTSITIAHRLSTIVSSQRILVVDGGSIVEDGTHQELMAKKGHYYKLYTSQFENLDIDGQLALSQKD